MEDRSLVNGDKQAQGDVLRSIYEEHRDYLLILAIALSNDVNTAEDAVHDVFVAFAGAMETFRLTGSLKAYLATCVANRVRDLARAKRNRAKALDAVRARLTPADATDPGRLVACNEQLQVLSAALAELPEEQREAVVLHIHGRMRFRTIAGSLGISVNTVKGRYRYGIRKLRSLFNGEIQT
jgi:RNA polymerase sigma factor (sigma-70 family)